MNLSNTHRETLNDVFRTTHLEALGGEWDDWITQDIRIYAHELT
jgi:hypothetical protein